MSRAAIVLVVLACAFVFSHANIPNSIVETKSGPVQGYVDLLSGVQTWRGIPFAAPPVGENRFRSPQPVASWNQTKSTTMQGQICPQFHILGSLELGGEDCLYLSVYVPPGADANSKLPVMFWIFGGGYVIGDGFEFGFYDGTNLAKTKNVIVVGANYRLGAFGFLAGPELQAEDPNLSTGNYALQDQQAALRWVSENIAAFGGDPSAVTIFGESAGAFSVCWHLVSPQSSGLFRAAVMESGTCDAPQFFQPSELTFAYSRAWMASIGCDRVNFTDGAAYLACLRALPTSAVMSGVAAANAPQSALSPLMPWGPTIDGSVSGLLQPPLLLIQRGKWNRVPLILGSNKDEGTLFVPAMFLLVPGTHYPLQAADLKPLLVHFFYNETLADLILQVYPDDGTATPDDRCAAVLRDYFFACSARRIARALDAQQVPVYLYHFTYKGDWIDDVLLGDYHSSEMEYVFDNAWPAIVHAFSANDQAMSDTFTYYWTNLAKFVDPNGNVSSTSQISWPTYSLESDENIVLQVPSTLQSHLYSGVCDFWDTYSNAQGVSARAPDGITPVDLPVHAAQTYSPRSDDAQLFTQQAFAELRAQSEAASVNATSPPSAYQRFWRYLTLSQLQAASLQMQPTQTEEK